MLTTSTAVAIIPVLAGLPRMPVKISMRGYCRQGMLQSLSRVPPETGSGVGRLPVDSLAPPGHRPDTAPRPGAGGVALLTRIPAAIKRRPEQEQSA